MAATRTTTTRCFSTYGSRFEPAQDARPNGARGVFVITRTGAMLIALVVGSSAASAQGVSGVSRAAEEKTVNLCSTCHGPRGISTSPEFPILAAQQKEYIVNQLHAFREKSRSEKDAHDFMWGIAAGLNDAMISEIAIFYSAQP